MALINHVKREINVKVVYFGPPGSGKGTNLNAIYKKLKPECRGKLKSMEVQNDRMIFFEFTPPGQEDLDGYRVRFHIYTLTGKVASLSSWKMVLKGVDGIVFIADSKAESLPLNSESFSQLRDILHAHGSDPGVTPTIIQYNKQDLESALPVQELERVVNPSRYPSVPANAAKGEGVLDCLSRLMRSVMQTVREGGVELPGDVDQVLRISPERGASAGPVGQAEGAVSPSPLEEGPTVTFDGNPEIADGGHLRVPLLVRAGGQEKRVSLLLSLETE